MAKRALLIGSPTFGLMAVETDIEQMARLLEGRGFHCRTLIGKNANRDSILDSYRAFAADTTDADAALVYYSGHGGRARAANEPGRRPLQFILPTDFDPKADEFRGITDLELTDLLTRLTTRTENVTTIFDCCHASGMSRGDTAVHTELRPRSLDVVWERGVNEHFAALREAGISVDRLDAVGNDRAVRLVATGPSHRAYEFSDETGVFRGLLTWAFCRTVTEAGERPITWRTLADRVRRLVTAIAFTQRPDVEGPSDRLLFDKATGADIGHLVAIDKGLVYIQAGRVHGVEVGDKFRLVPEGSATTVLGEGTVGRVETARARLDFPSALDLPANVPLRAVPTILVNRNWVVDVHGTDPALDAVRAVVKSSGFLCLGGGDAEEAPLAVVELRDGMLQTQLLGDRSLLPCPPAMCGELVGGLRALARARTLATLPTGEGPAKFLHEYCVEWGVVVDGRRTPPPADGLLPNGTPLFVSVTNRGPKVFYVHFVDIGLASAIELVNESYPSGVEVSPGDEYVLGADGNRELTGLAPYWPNGVPKERPRDETVVVLIFDQPVDLSGIGQKGVAERSEFTGGARLWAALSSGRRTRELPKVGAPEIRYAAEPITFTVAPPPT